MRPDIAPRPQRSHCSHEVGFIFEPDFKQLRWLAAQLGDQVITKVNSPR